MSVLTETVRLLRAALALDTPIADKWQKVLPDDTVERIIHILQVRVVTIYRSIERVSMSRKHFL